MTNHLIRLTLFQGRMGRDEVPPEILKKAKYWTAFTSATRLGAEEAAAAWWAEQDGFDKVSSWTLPAGPPTAAAKPGWTVTIVYTILGEAADTKTLH
jgi:hypothetical protein